MMRLDPDLVRVDLLKVKRKLYLSLADNPVEQKNFLLSTKKSELSYFKQQMPPELTEHVFQEHEKMLKKEYYHIGFNIMLAFVGLALSILLYKGFNHLWILYMGLMPFMYGLCSAYFHMQHVSDAITKIQPFIKEYNTVTGHIKRLTNELKQIE